MRMPSGPQGRLFGARISSRRWAWVSLVSLSLLMAVIAVYILRAPPERYFDDRVSGALLAPPAPAKAGDRDGQIALLSDCAPRNLPPNCGDPPALWHRTTAIPICPSDAAIPQWVSPTDFHLVLEGATKVWNGANAQVGLEYVPNCANPTQGSAIPDGAIAVGWGGDRSFIVASVVGTTNVGVEAFNLTSGRREISGAQIVINPRQAMSVRCLQTMMVHELGHVLGLGHSTNADDVMFPIFTPSMPTSCKTRLRGPGRPPRARPDADARFGCVA